ncbi:hypothetical protein [Phenylobacterium sp. J367]|uniref:hypothetical protein n=1 Tax=Phenylobacterium sp. J367 TaxID=2898435 RepID=UPI0021515EED|nr:hypothetical protein [Phenylobacterium sp. J367]MCR5877259.1 hypothetical protein [Phenylobacterium sp. J367]
MLAAEAAAVAPAPPPGTRLASGDCFRTSDIRNHTIADNRTLLIDVQGRGAYRIGMSGACLAGATSSDPLIMRSPPGSTIACAPIDLDIGVRHVGGYTSPCIPESVMKLSEAQVAALPAKLRP